MRSDQTFVSGRHLAAARTFAGLTQKALAREAGLNVNSIKRLEQMDEIYADAPHATACIRSALAKHGVVAERWPFPYIKLVEPE